MPMENVNSGGTRGEVENSELACKMVPSPPSVQMRSVLRW